MEGDHLDMQKSVTETRLYQNLTESVPLMGFYDVKNARLCNIFEGEGLRKTSNASSPLWSLSCVQGVT